MKKKTNKGFTLVELLVAMTILGLMMALVVPNVLKITDSNTRQGYVNDATKLINLAKYKISIEKSSKPNKDNNCTVYGFAYLDNAEINKPPNGGCYDVNRSFVLVKYDHHEYHYYVRLVEAYMDGENISYVGLGLTNLASEDNDDIKKTNVILENTNTTKFNFTNNAPFNTGISCTGTVKYLLHPTSLNYELEYQKNVGGNTTGLCALD